MPTYSYKLEYANEHVDDKGVGTPREILAAFDEFDWPGQISEANRLERCSPTLSVEDVDSERLFWVSGCGTPEEFTFVNHYTYPGRIKRLFGLIQYSGIVDAPTHDLSPADARRAIESFLDANHEELLRVLAP